jgi:hypothetical protein
VPAWPGRVGEEWRGALNPPVDGDVIDLDATLAEELFDVAVGQPVPQISPNGEDDDRWRKPEACKR